MYGLGAFLRMITGSPLPGQRARHLAPGDVDRTRATVGLCPAVPPDLETICLKAIRKLPEDRYHTPREMGEDLDRFLRGDPVLARAVPFGTRIARRAARHRAITLLSILIFCTLFSWVCLRLRDARPASQGLDRARALSAELKWSEARSAYLDVLKLDPGNGEARTGLDRADAEVRRREADLAARQALEKARLVQGVLARWIPLAETSTWERVAYRRGSAH